MIHSLCDGNILRMDEVVKVNMHTALQWIAYQIDKVWMERQQIKNSR